MSTATSDEIALLAAIVANPADDTARLVYADYLDELGGERVEVPCPRCKDSREPGWRHRHGRNGPGYYACEACADIENGDTRGTGKATVIDTSRTDRAAFIRCQIELATLVHNCDENGCCWGDCPKCDLQRRESELLARNHPRWLPVCHCNYRDGGFVYDGLGAEDCPSCGGSGRAGVMRRGFLERVEVPTLSDVLVNVQNYPDMEAYREERDSVMQWRPTDFARTLFRGEWATVERVVALDREPFEFVGGLVYGDVPGFDLVGPHFMFQWFDGDDRPRGHRIPKDVMLRLWELTPANRRWKSSAQRTRNCYFPTADAAKTALASALTDTLRALCGGET